jgi:hypothetical protein
MVQPRSKAAHGDDTTHAPGLSEMAWCASRQACSEAVSRLVGLCLGLVEVRDLTQGAKMIDVCRTFGTPSTHPDP